MENVSIVTFMLSNSGSSLLGLKSTKEVNSSISLLSSDCRSLSDLILRCSKATKVIKIPPFKLEFDGDPIFVRSRMISCGLSESIKKVSDPLVFNDVLEPVMSSKRATPFAAPLKVDGKGPENRCGLLRDLKSGASSTDVYHRKILRLYYPGSVNPVVLPGCVQSVLTYRFPYTLAAVSCLVLTSRLACILINDRHLY